MSGLSVSDPGVHVAQATRTQPSRNAVDQAAVAEYRDMVANNDFRTNAQFGRHMLEYAASAPVNQATRDAMVEAYFDVLNNPATPDLERSILRLGTEYVSLPYQSDPAAASRIADSVGRLVDSGRLTADDLFGMLDPGFYGNVTDGSRALLTEVTDGAVLQQLAERVLDASRAIPLNDRGNDAREMGLIAAADIANMAAANGASRAANTVVAAIASELRAGNISATSMIELHGDQNNTILADRSALNALAGLLNATPDTAANRADRDILFSALVKSTPDGAGLQRFGASDTDNVPAALSDLADYFSRNAPRLITEAAENRTLVGAVPAADAHYDLLVADFARNVLLHPDLADADRTRLTDSLGRTMADLSAAALDPNAPADVRNRATQDFALLSGSLARAIEGSVADAGRRASEQIALARIVTDQVTDAAVKYAATTAGPAGFVVSHAGKEQVTAFWNMVQQRAVTAEQTRTNDATMPLLTIAQAFRDTLGSIRNQEGASQLPFQFDEVFDTTRRR